jgi:hypothetical protein
MKLNKLTTAIVGVMMTAGMGSSALAEPSPEMTSAERGLFACTEQALSIVAAATDATRCEDLRGNYSYHTFAQDDGTCDISVDYGDLYVAGTVLFDDRNGTHIATALGGGGQYFANVKVKELSGDFMFSPNGEIMVHTSYFGLKPDGNLNWEPYDEHVIKDYKRAKVFGGNPDKPNKLNGIKDNGLEAITKTQVSSQVDLPRAKWREHSQFQEPDGVDGLHSITKTLTVIDGYNNPCTIQIRKATVIDFGGALDALGVIRVR